MSLVPAGIIAPGTIDSSGKDISGRPYGGYEVLLTECEIDGRVYSNDVDGFRAHQATESHKVAVAKM